jgi:hypothetical protein
MSLQDSLVLVVRGRAGWYCLRRRIVMGYICPFETPHGVGGRSTRKTADTKAQQTIEETLGSPLGP